MSKPLTPRVALIQVSGHQVGFSGVAVFLGDVSAEPAELAERVVSLYHNRVRVPHVAERVRVRVAVRFCFERGVRESTFLNTKSHVKGSHLFCQLYQNRNRQPVQSDCPDPRAYLSSCLAVSGSNFVPAQVNFGNQDSACAKAQCMHDVTRVRTRLSKMVSLSSRLKQRES